MTQENLDSNETMILNGLDELLVGVTAPCPPGCQKECTRHESVVALIKYLTQLTKTLFKQQSEITVLMKDLRAGQAFLVRTRKLILWASVAIGGAVLSQWGQAIFLAIKLALTATGVPTP